MGVFLQTHLVVENIIIIYPDRSKFSQQFYIVHFCCQNTDAKLLHPFNFHGSASVLYKLLYRPLFFGNVLDLILFGSNKGYCSCSSCHHFHMVTLVTCCLSEAYKAKISCGSVSTSRILKVEAQSRMHLSTPPLPKRKWFIDSICCSHMRSH
jgi:hypothetical protein